MLGWNPEPVHWETAKAAGNPTIRRFAAPMIMKALDPVD
jgi:hypothetical protein